MILRLTGAVILGAVLVSTSVAAQNLGPSSEVTTTTLGPSYDPFQMAPANPTPVMVLVAPPPPAAPPPTPFDGIWFGSISCGAYHEKPSLIDRVIMEIKNGGWSRLNALTTTPGQPGYDHYEATTSADGHVTLTRTAIADGHLPDAARTGEAISSKFVGMFRGATFTAWGVSGRCSIQLAKQL
ncbi:MAG TPA: hypothetical protein VNV38_01420 [Stellaceae bacterium]|jgi:hypothetical protein|nr:hypothetical protein [Stellaceae bacterium]